MLLKIYSFNCEIWIFQWFLLMLIYVLKLITFDWCRYCVTFKQKTCHITYFLLVKWLRYYLVSKFLSVYTQKMDNLGTFELSHLFHINFQVNNNLDETAWYWNTIQTKQNITSCFQLLYLKLFSLLNTRRVLWNRRFHRNNWIVHFICLPLTSNALSCQIKLIDWFERILRRIGNISAM